MLGGKSELGFPRPVKKYLNSSHMPGFTLSYESKKIAKIKPISFRENQGLFPNAVTFRKKKT